jgi:hypothetical protein
MEDNNVNVIQFPDRSGSGMPMDRSGAMDAPLRRKSLKEQRAEEKQAKEAKKEQERISALLESPVTKKEFQRAMFNIFGSMEKVVAEFRKLAVMNEALRTLLYSQGTITREDYEAYTGRFVAWNAKIDAILQSYGTTPLNEIVKAVSDWNNQNELKIEWQHIDIAPRILADESITLEDKLLIATDLNMPEPFIQELRNRENGNFAAEAASEALSEALSEVGSLEDDPED